MTFDERKALQAIAGTIVMLVVTFSSFGAQAQDFVTSMRRSVASGWKPDTLDYGIGILSFSGGPGYGSSGRRDTIIAYEKPLQHSKVVGLFMLSVSEDGNGWTYAIASNKSLKPNVLEFDYEECGVPFDTILASDRWARAVLGFQQGNEALRGWIRLDSATVQFIKWLDELPRHELFFLPETRPQFFDRENGCPLLWEVSSGPPYNYIMHPLDVRPPWMQVRVARPADICAGQGEVRCDTLRAWIRYIDKNGRPTVWYYTRGC